MTFLGSSGRRGFAVLLAAVLILPTAASAQFSDSYNFLKAVRDRDGAKVTELLSQPSATIVDTKDRETGEGVLHIVVKRRDATWLSFLMGKGANPNARDNDGNTPLMLAAQIGFAEAVQLLLGQRANVDLANSSGETPLIKAVQSRDLPTVRLLLTAGANPRRTDSVAGLSARDYAERDGRSQAILKLIDETKATPQREVAGPTL